jgi:C4-dicarboxylate-specific signal transduction histidine kinase
LERITHEQALLTQETKGLQQNIDHIKQIVAMQQSYAKVSGALENLAIHELVEDALRISSSALARHQIEIVREFDSVPSVLVSRHAVLQILVNLVSNAKEALDTRAEGRCLTLRISQSESERVRVEVGDNGIGIPAENITKMFQHGFTTKKSGHGFGLHSAANAAKEMGGSLAVHSHGPGTGATFILELPPVQIPQQEKAA